MADTSGCPKISRLVYLSMVLQAEGIRYGVEHWRRDREPLQRHAVLAVDDCWPVSSWSSIDYFGRWKALHYATRQFYAPVLLSAEVEADAVSLAVTNDGAAAWRGEVRWSLERLDGEVVASGGGPAAARALATTSVGRVPLPDSAAERRSLVLVSELLEAGSRRALIVTTFVPDKQLALGRTAVEAAVETAVGAAVDGSAGAAAGRATVRLRSGTLARWVELSLDGADVILDDNYFDLPAGRDVTVSFELPEGWDLVRARAALRVRSVVDTYA